MRVISSSFSLLLHCPGFSWDRVNFHKKPGADTAGKLTQTSTGHRVTPWCDIMLGSEWGSWLGGGESRLASALGTRW